MKRVGSLLALAVTTGLLAWGGSSELRPEAVLQASEFSHVQDSDGDLLPDLLEMVLLSDPQRPDTSRDGRDDLQEFLDRTLPGLEGAAPRRLGNSVRVGVTSELLEKSAASERVFWIHLAFRVQSGNMADLQALGLFFQIGPLQVPIDRFFRDPRNMIRARITESGALIGVLSVRVSLGYGLEMSVPFQFCAGGLIGGKPCLSAAYIFPEGRQYLHLLPLAAMTCIFSGLDPLQKESQLWLSNQICTTELGVVGFSGGTVVYEITSASCKTFNAVRCPPSCADRKGTVVVAPDGWSLIEGD